MDHHNIAELYTQVKILSVLEINDSISDMQRKTSLSFVTTQKGVNDLEKIQLIKTEKKLNKKGRSRECIWFSEEHHIFCKQLIIILDNLNMYLNNKIAIELKIKETMNKLTKVKIERKIDDKQSTLESY
ncbi:MAG: hypothetical protein MPEBLZ_02638 [Candidatus Methanoperedens nitroreducens]|uniref:Transcriptional regulator n=1 Tax=Candidatus Methanoperedens nitratireducens TaxID=1392998 RepID=A0A0P8DYD3_9EURY|nr:hypothetical protein [Candidatus Methanoperedens sp. BLZ2]KAB2942178.1 MAG: hypothetical protein F9K14_17445 [Candidatus Methanoperedens sp.]KPQ42797.1 MAG: hypothetical protein MPEBLZ_02638 [Candidatus Methanoperedens sp. BLZ1]MBZ0173676.1 hypothetical protein [Candidatus Methanoperedens nitroreducens]MCX9076352.1 hypothetical protein [Candidatus Methanoperedens sp.]